MTFASWPPISFILVIAEKESQIKRRNDTLMKKETDLETFAKVLTGKENLMYDYEKSLSDRAKNLEYKEKQYGVQVGHTGMKTKKISSLFGFKIQNLILWIENSMFLIIGAWKIHSNHKSENFQNYLFGLKIQYVFLQIENPRVCFVDYFVFQIQYK